VFWESDAARRVQADPTYRRGAVYLAGLLLALVANRAIIWWLPPMDALSGLARIALVGAEIVDLAALTYFAAFAALWLVYRAIARIDIAPRGLIAAGLGLVGYPLLLVILRGHGEGGDSIAVVGAIVWWFILPALIADLRILVSGLPAAVRVPVVGAAVVAALAFPIVAWSAITR
jgi:hypothetical protein